MIAKPLMADGGWRMADCRKPCWALLGGLWLIVWALPVTAIALTVAAVKPQSAIRNSQSDEARLAAHFQEATAAQRAGKLEEAAAAYAQVIRLRPDLGEAYVNFGLVRHEQKQFAEAIKLFQQAIRLKPELVGAHLFLGIDYYWLGRFELAIKSLQEAARLAPNHPPALMWLGVAYLAAGQAAPAARHLDQAAQLAPNDVDTLYHRGRAHLKLSQESYQQMFKADPQSARVHQVLAQSYAEAGKDTEAIAEYETTIKLAPTLPGVREALGSLYWKNNRMDEAEQMFEAELKLDQHNAVVLYKAGGMRVERGQPERGLPLLEAAVRQQPELIDAYYYLGKAQALLGQNQQAVVNLNQVIAGQAAPHLIESAYYQLARVYRKLGRLAEAEAALQKVKEARARQRTNTIEKLEEIKQRQPEAPVRQP